jgi:hypothetical protein
VLWEEHAVRVISPPRASASHIIRSETARKVTPSYGASDVFDEPAHETSLAPATPTAQTSLIVAAPAAAAQVDVGTVAAGQYDSALIDERAPSAGRIQRRSRMFPGRTEGRHAKTPVTRGPGLAHNGAGGRAFAAIWDLRPMAAGLLAVRPVPSCTASVPRGVNDESPSDVYPVQVACRCRQPVTTLRPDPPYPARPNELYWNPLHARIAA